MVDRKIKILTIDDNPDNLITVNALIHDMFPNAEVSQASNGMDGLRLAAQVDPDVILLDVVMPGMDGFEVCRRLKHDQKLQDTPIVFLTALKGDKDSRIKALYYGAEAFLSKPIDESELMAQIRAMVKIKAANRQKKMEKAELETLVANRTKQLEMEFAKRKEYEQELIQAKEHAEESDRLKTSFLQNMSHEIRTPMNAIIGFTGLLENEALPVEDRKKFVGIVRNSANQLLSVVTDILTISSLEKKMERININILCINSLMDDLLTIFQGQAIKKNLCLTLKKSASDLDSQVYTDGTKLTEILTNLLTNALKFTHDGEIEFGYSIQDSNFEFYVKDTGIGIKAENQEKIFHRFLQADLSINQQYGGTGLGLSISKGFVELFGGKLWVESKLNKGSIFKFTIPYISARNILDANDDDRSASTCKTILIAEDEEYNYLFIKHVLACHNIRFIHSRNGAEAVELCRDIPNIDLVLMDIKMPVMDGYSAAKMIKDIKPDLTIIAQTAYAMDAEREKFASSIFDDYVVKPINVKELKTKVKKFIDC